MIATILFILSTWCFVSAFGMWFEWTAKSHVYTLQPYPSFMAFVAVIDGLVLAVVAECFFINLRWFWVFLINLPTLWWLSPLFSRRFFVRFKSAHHPFFHLYLENHRAMALSV